MIRAISRFMGTESGPPIVPVSGWSAPLTTLSATATAFLAVLAIAFGIAAGRLADAWRTDLAGLATVQVNAPRDRLPERVASTLAVLETTAGIGSTRVLSEAEHQELLAPWLGEEVDLAVLPAPRLIEVSFEGSGPDAERLQRRLDREVPGVTYDDHRAWRAPLATAADRLEALALFATGLIGLAAAGMVALAARATLSANLEIVRTVRLIGGDDGFIAGSFVRRLGVRAFAGGMIGSAGAGAALLALPRVSEAGLFEISLQPGPLGWALLLLAVPVASGAIAWATAAVSVKIALRRLM